MNLASNRLAPGFALMLLAGLALPGTSVVPLRAAEGLPPVGVMAPELTGKVWLNLPSGQTLSLASRKGKVTILHFWTYGCINCRRNLPAYDRWHKRFASKGVVVIGIHSPETEGERDLANVTRKVKELGIAYPVLDPNMGILFGWKAFVAAILGGRGSILGACLAGFVLGFIEVFVATIFPSTFRDLIAYSLILLILVFRPHGFFGEAYSAQLRL